MHRLEKLNFHLYKPEEISSYHVEVNKRLIEMMIENQKLVMRFLSFPITEKARFNLEHMQSTLMTCLTKLNNSEDDNHRKQNAHLVCVLWENIVSMFNTVQEAVYSQSVADFTAMGFDAFQLGPTTKTVHTTPEAVAKKGKLRLVASE